MVVRKFWEWMPCWGGIQTQSDQFGSGDTMLGSHACQQPRRASQSSQRRLTSRFSRHTQMLSKNDNRVTSPHALLRVSY